MPSPDTTMGTPTALPASTSRREWAMPPEMMWMVVPWWGAIVFLVVVLLVTQR